MYKNTRDGVEYKTPPQRSMTEM